MEITKDTVVSFQYTMTDDEGNVLEQSDAKHPSVYLHGHNNLMPAIEEALDGKSVGDELKISLTPEQTYGERKEDRAARVPVKHLISPPKRMQPGMMVQMNTSEGPVPVTILKVGKFNVDVDTNHPLAGMDLVFEITVTDVREASEEEVAHGHVHGPGGHHH